MDFILKNVGVSMEKNRKQEDNDAQQHKVFPELVAFQKITLFLHRAVPRLPFLVMMDGDVCGVSAAYIIMLRLAGL